MIFNVNLFAQHREAAQATISKLCSDDFAGRGYINNGDGKAAAYIANRMKDAGLKSLTPGYFNPFTMNVNTVTKAEMRVNDKRLVPGYDYLVAPDAKSVVGEFKVFFISPKLLASTAVAKKVKRAIKKGFVPVITQYDASDKKLQDHMEEIKKCNAGSTLIFLRPSLTWSVSQTQSKGTEIYLVDSIFDRFSSSISLNIEATLIANYKTQNVIGYVKGTEFPDSFIILCGHYDHLGKMGEATFYGANDNASGISMMLDMVDFFVKNPQKYSVAFIAFGGEEAGLVGSLYYVRNPVIPLGKTKFVFNMDLMGSGDKGATIVNGTIFKDEYDQLVKINTARDYLPVINARGKAANSDHYFFTEAGVPAFFIYLMGDYMHYHIPQDNPENLLLGPYYDKTFQLIRDFVISLN
jgi:aminopeptidase YwaD